MDGKDRDYDVIVKGIKDMGETLDQLRESTKKMKEHAETAQTSLRDDIGKKNSEAIIAVAEAILKILQCGEERVRELERKMKGEEAWVKEHSR